uniref:Uncharacterized protein n=1 Tax=Caenorhabditis japonica TaxID=281687 RepID=A0A8R1IDD6_CAEJA
MTSTSPPSSSPEPLTSSNSSTESSKPDTCTLKMVCKNPTLLDLASIANEPYSSKTRFCTNSILGTKNRAVRILVKPLLPAHRLVMKYQVDFILTPENFEEYGSSLVEQYGNKDFIYLSYTTDSGNTNIAFLKLEENTCSTQPESCPPYTFEDIIEMQVVICMNQTFTPEEFNESFDKIVVCADEDCKYRL